MQHRIDQQDITHAKSFTYSSSSFIIFFMLMQLRGIYGFKTQSRWLINHPEALQLLGWQQPPHRTTIARRYKALSEIIAAFVSFIGQYAADLSEQSNRTHLVIDKSLFMELTYVLLMALPDLSGVGNGVSDDLSPNYKSKTLETEALRVQLRKS